MRRQSAALLGDVEAGDNPVRRISGATVGSVVVAALALVVAGVFGLVRPGGQTGWHDGKSLIVVRETGTRYLYLSGVLHPVLNYASARLVLRSATITEVPQSALDGTPRGGPVGIVGAPDALPDPGSLLHGAWIVCAQPAIGPAGIARPVVQLKIGPPAPGAPLSTSDGLLARGTASGQAYLVWNAHRLRLTAPESLFSALDSRFRTVKVTEVGDAWLNTLPQGPDLGVLSIAGKTQLFQVGDAGYVMLSDGLAPVNELQLRLLQASSGVAPTLLTDQQLAAAPKSAQSPATLPDLPSKPLRLADPGADGLAPCTSTTDAASIVSLAPADAARKVDSGLSTVDSLGFPVAESIAIAPGHGALVRAAAATYLVTDTGVKYPIASAEALDALGYKGIVPAALPVTVLSVLPAGPALDVKAAASLIPVGPGSAYPVSVPSGQ